MWLVTDAGAYVLYPGNGSSALESEFHELLPGLGAFPLRPVPGGDTAGAEALETFVRDVARNVADQATAMERTQYWTARYNQREGRRVRPVEFLTRPPADTLVLVGYVRWEQRDWVLGTKQYNVRVGDRRGAVDLSDDVIAAEVVVLWTRGLRGDVDFLGGFERVGPWQVAMADELGAAGYPVKNRTHRYLVTRIEPLPVALDDLVTVATPALMQDHPGGAPWTTSWSSLTGA